MWGKLWRRGGGGGGGGGFREGNITLSFSLLRGEKLLCLFPFQGRKHYFVFFTSTFISVLGISCDKMTF